jgi:hypothetical protein
VKYDDQQSWDEPNRIVMDRGALVESFDGNPMAKQNDYRSNKQLSCPTCEATNFPNLSKLKSVLLTAACGYHPVNPKVASIEIHTIGLMNVWHRVALSASLNDRILIDIPRANMGIQRFPRSFTIAP